MYLTNNSLEILPHVVHGFFTRKNGVSSGLYESLNCGWGSKDEQENIVKNYAYVSKQMDVSHVNTVKQIHSNKIVFVGKDNKIDDRLEADGMVTNESGVALGILTADCAPVLFADKTKPIIGAVHSGRKGALTGIVPNVINAMCELGSKAGDIYAVMGPSISKKNYEVGKEIFTEMSENFPQYMKHIYQIEGKQDNFLLDVGGIIAEQAKEAGIRFININRCTYDEASLFYSYRRTTHKKETDYGRLISVISLR